MKGRRSRALTAYLRSRLAVILVLILCTLLFVLVLSLYHVETEPAVYAGALCLLGLGVLLIIDLTRFLNKRKTLLMIEEGLPETLRHLPSPTGSLEEDYQALLRDMARLYADRISLDDQRYQQMAQYYTLWSHQIKTPLAAMRLLLSKTDSQEGRALQIELMKTEHYVAMALNYMKLDGPGSDFHFAPAPLKALANEAARRYAGQFVGKRLSLSLQVPEDVVVTTDRKWLVFVLEQLLSNAVKYTREGGVVIHWDQDSRSLAVRDSGIGIDPADLPRVFEQGFTGYTGRVEQQATGIGLFLCQEICRRLGHGIRLQSVQGEGSKAILSFPDHHLPIE